MPLSPGAPFGSYEILAPLGAGGMGEVYRARDLTLRRDVARDGRILLLELVASSTERLVHVVVNWTPRRAPGT